MQEISEKKSGKLQVWLIFMCVFAYTVSYVSRYSYNANIVAIREYLLFCVRRGAGGERTAVQAL